MLTVVRRHKDNACVLETDTVINSQWALSGPALGVDILKSMKLLP